MIVERARALLGARYAAIGVPDERGEAFRHFVVSGMTEEQIASLPHGPRARGLLAVNLLDGRSLRVADAASHPRSEGVPEGHPPVESFLGANHRFLQSAGRTAAANSRPGGAWPGANVPHQRDLAESDE